MNIGNVFGFNLEKKQWDLNVPHIVWTHLISDKIHV